METPSLEYFDTIFGARGPEFWELVDALVAELQSYAEDLGPLVASRDRAGLARLRHSHRPLVENLGLKELAAIEQTLRTALDDELPEARLAELLGEFQFHSRVAAQVLGDTRAGARGNPS